MAGGVSTTRAKQTIALESCDDLHMITGAQVINECLHFAKLMIRCCGALAGPCLAHSLICLECARQAWLTLWLRLWGHNGRINPCIVRDVLAEWFSADLRVKAAAHMTWRPPLYRTTTFRFRSSWPAGCGAGEGFVQLALNERAAVWRVGSSCNKPLYETVEIGVGDTPSKTLKPHYTDRQSVSYPHPSFSTLKRCRHHSPRWNLEWCLG